VDELNCFADFIGNSWSGIEIKFHRSTQAYEAMRTGSGTDNRYLTRPSTASAAAVPIA
jgi:hypothetical protein